MTLQLRKIHYDFLELDASRMGKLRPREEVICPHPISSLPSFHQPSTRRPLGRMGYAHLGGLLREVEAQEYVPLHEPLSG